MLIRIYVGPQLGDHVQLRVFANEKGRGYTLGKCGDLTFRAAELEGFLTVLTAGAKSTAAVKQGIDVEVIHEKPRPIAPAIE